MKMKILKNNLWVEMAGWESEECPNIKINQEYFCNKRKRIDQCNTKQLYVTVLLEIVIPSC